METTTSISNFSVRPLVRLSYIYIYIYTTTTQRAKKEILQRGTLSPSTPTVDTEMQEKTSKTISTVAILWPVKAILEKRAATVEVDTFISPGCFQTFGSVILVDSEVTAINHQHETR